MIEILSWLRLHVGPTWPKLDLYVRSMYIVNGKKHNKELFLKDLFENCNISFNHFSLHTQIHIQEYLSQELPNSKYPKVRPLNNKNWERLYILGVVCCLSFAVHRSVVRHGQGCPNYQIMLQGWVNSQSKANTLIVSKQKIVDSRSQTGDNRQQTVESRQQT